MPMLWFGLGSLVGALCAAAVAALLTKQIVRRARAAERRARDARRLAEIGGMTQGLAHEIKNPLSSIGLNAQLLAEAIDESPLPAEERDRFSRRVGALRREVDRLRDILADFLRYAGAMRLDPVPAELNAVVAETADFFAAQADAAGVRMRLDLSPAPLNVIIDVNHFKQALLNLMLNAVQAMSPGGAADPGGARELIIRTQAARDPSGPQAVAHVIDTGPGIPPGDVETIFTPYFTTKSGGSGLGLPTARRFIEEMQGRLDVHSEPGRGTDFSITLPTA